MKTTMVKSTKQEYKLFSVEIMRKKDFLILTSRKTQNIKENVFRVITYMMFNCEMLDKILGKNCI